MTLSSGRRICPSALQKKRGLSNARTHAVTPAPYMDNYKGTVYHPLPLAGGHRKVGNP